MKKLNKKASIGLAVMTLLSLVALLSVAIGRRHSGKFPAAPLKGVAVRKEIKRPVYDSAMLRKLLVTTHSLDFNKLVCTYAGTVEMNDPNDTTNNVHDLKFLFARSGEDYYYQVGNVEIIHQHLLNVYIQHDQQKVALSDHAIVIKPPVNDLALLGNALASDDYALVSHTSGRHQTLGLINEHHISCKELSVTLDSVSGKLERIYMRTTDFGNPHDKNKDRTIDVRITAISNASDMDLYPALGSVVNKAGNAWALTSKYRTYELIRF